MKCSLTMPASAAHWSGGWYSLARRLDSPNFGERAADAVVDLIVVHSISLPPGHFGNGCVQQFFTNQLDWRAHPYFQEIQGLQVSAHFFITRTGDLYQFVSTQHRAWHAGLSHYRGRHNCNDDSIGIELEGLEGKMFESAQYQTLIALCTALLVQHPIAHIAGHSDVAPGRKFDPGAGFDWAWVQQKLALPKAGFPQR